MAYGSGFMILVSFLTLSSAHIFPESKELIYDYHATVTVGTKEPDFYVTKYEIFADLHVKNKERTWVQLKDVHYSYYFGSSLIETSEKIRAPPEADVITLPFGLYKIDPKGTDKGVSLDANDEKWSKNIKMFIGTLLRVDEKFVLQNKFTYEAVNVYEMGNFGREYVEYTYIPTPTMPGHIMFSKRGRDKINDDWYLHASVLPNCDDCGVKKTSIQHSDVRRYYDIIKEGDGFKLNSVHSNNTFQFVFNEEKFFGSVDQLIVLKSEKDLTEELPEIVKPLTDPDEDPEEDPAVVNGDLTGGRRKRKMTSIKSSVESIFLSICDRALEINVEKSNIDLDAEDNAIALIDEMRSLDNVSLYELYTELSQNDQLKDKSQLEIYVLALGHTGTRESLMVILQLITEKLISEELALKTLREIPFHVKPSDLLYFSEMKNLIEDESRFSRPVRDAIVLTSSALVKRTFDMNDKKSILSGVCGDYIYYFSDKLTNVTDSDEQLLYVSALSNLQCFEVLDYAKSIVRDETQGVDFSPHIRSFAMIGFLNFLKNVQEEYTLAWSPEISNLYLPLFLDAKEDYEVRATALHLLLHYGTDGDLEAVLKHMENEEDEQFLRMFHTAVESAMRTASDCHKDKIKTILKPYSEMLKPEFSPGATSFVKLLDYYDESNKFGSMFKYSMYGEESVNGFNTVYLKYNWKFMNFNFDQYTIYLNMKKDPSAPGHVIGVPEILSLSEKEMPIEMVVFRNNLIIRIIRTSPRELLKYLFELKNSDGFPLKYSLDQTYNNELTIGSDMGIPVTFYHKKPTLTVTKAVSSSDGNSRFSNIQFSRWSRGEYGLRMYNPIANMWHGVQRVQSEDVNIYAEIENQDTHKFILKMNDKRSLPLGIRTEVQTEVYTSGAVSMKTIVQSNKSPRENHAFWSVDDENTGLSFDFGIFNCEAQQKDKHVHQIKQRFLTSDTKNSGENLWFDLYLVAQRVWDYFSVFPGTGKCGLKLNIGKSKSVNLTHYEADVKKVIHTIEKPKGIEKAKLKIALKGMQGNETLKKFEIVLTDNLAKKPKFSGTFEIEYLKQSRSNPYMISSVDLHPSIDDIRLNISIMSGEKDDQEIRTSSGVNLTITGKLSEHQNDQDREIRLYYACLSKTLVDRYDCIKKLTSLRSYDFDISYKEPVAVFDTIKEYFYGLIKSVYPDAFEKIDTSKKIDEGKIKMSSTYPLESEGVVDFSLSTSSGKIDIENLNLENLTIVNLFEPYSGFNIGELSFKSYCEFTANNIWNVKRENDKHFVLPAKWTRMTGSCHNNKCSWEVSAKRIDEIKNALALRIAFPDEIVDIHIDKDVEIYSNDKLMDISGDSRYFHTKFTDMKVHKDYRNAVVKIQSVPLIIDFKGKYVKIHMVHKNRDGKCHT